jgi:hypothetical protein
MPEAWPQASMPSPGAAHPEAGSPARPAGLGGAGADPEASWRPARVVAVALLIGVVLVGLRGEIPALGRHGPQRQHPVLIGLILEAVLAALLIGVRVRRRRARDSAWLAARLRGALNVALGAGLVAVPAALLVTHLPPPRPHKPRPRPGPTLGPTSILGRGHPQGTGIPVGTILTGLAVLVLAAAVVVALIAAWRRTGHLVTPVAVGAEADDGEQLREAVESGEAALRELGDARAAIVACYVAMERELAGAGAARAAADTPDELLARAARAGLIHGGAAGRLTALFYAARFSTHPVPPASRDQALQALRELAADLAARPRARAGPGTAEPGTAGAGPAPGGSSSPGSSP